VSEANCAHGKPWETPGDSQRLTETHKRLTKDSKDIQKQHKEKLKSKG
jgi:hypothetical protein